MGATEALEQFSVSRLVYLIAKIDVDTERKELPELFDCSSSYVYLQELQPCLYMRGETPIGTPPFSVAEQKADFSRRGYPPPLIAWTMERG